MNFLTWILDWVLSWIIFGPDSTFDWIIKNLSNRASLGTLPTRINRARCTKPSWTKACLGKVYQSMTLTYCDVILFCGNLKCDPIGRWMAIEKDKVDGSMLRGKHWKKQHLNSYMSTMQLAFGWKQAEKRLDRSGKFSKSDFLTTHQIWALKKYHQPDSHSTVFEKILIQNPTR